MGNYTTRTHSSSPWRDDHYLLHYAAARVAEDPEGLETWTRKVFRLVFASGRLDFGECWDRLFVAGVASGLDHLICQERIGQAVAHCRAEQVAA